MPPAPASTARTPIAQTPAPAAPVDPASLLAFPVTPAMKAAVAGRDPHAPISLAQTADQIATPLVAPTPGVLTPLERFFEDLLQAKRVVQAQLGAIEGFLTRIGTTHAVLPDELKAMMAELDAHMRLVADNAAVEKKAREQAQADATKAAAAAKIDAAKATSAEKDVAAAHAAKVATDAKVQVPAAL